MEPVTSFKRNSYKHLGIFLAIIIFVRCRPFYLWDYEDVIRPTCAVIVTIIALMNLSKEKWAKYIFVLLASSYLWATIFVDHSNAVTVFNFLGFAFIPLIRKDLILATYESFRKIFVAVISLSFVFYVLAALGMPRMGILTHQNGPDLYTYELFPFLVRGLGKIDGFSLRFQALFDEAGLLGTISGLLLVSERMNLKKRGNQLLLVCSLFTLSFYFYVCLAFGFIFFSKGTMKNRWKIFALCALFVAITYRMPFFYDNLWYRFEYDAEAGSIAGDNRNGWGLKDFYESILWTPAFYTGLGTTFAEQFSGAASLNLVIVKHGLIFVLLNVGAYLLLSFREIKNKPTWLMFVFFFLLTLYQRPGLYATYSIFLYTMVIYKFAEEKQEPKIKILKI